MVEKLIAKAERKINTIAQKIKRTEEKKRKRKRNGMRNKKTQQ